MNRIVPVGAALLVAAGFGVWWWVQHRPHPVIWQGYAEADFVKIGPTQPGLLMSVDVHRGDEVAAGQILFTQDATPDRAARDQAAHSLAQEEEQLKNLQMASRTTEIDEAAANVADAEATVTRTAADLRRGEALLPRGAVTKQSVDQMRADHQSAMAKLAAMQAALDQARAPVGRARQIEAQQAAVAGARAALAAAEWRLAQRTVAAPTAGRIADVLARPGEVMATAAPVVSLLPPGNIFVRFFVPENIVARLRRGGGVTFSCDFCPADLGGTISYIAPQAEYTPPVIYSEESREKLVFRIEARPRADEIGWFHPGEPMEVRPVGWKATP
ncbi:MAG TPA: HlyD family efflux transporter periplasmic adaptor subunit [Acetobacteraceae bacterium]|nr:HlyD family efflux transporter periplasmic adaptor subunit [Acetobacteraceae bacterium]